MKWSKLFRRKNRKIMTLTVIQFLKQPDIMMVEPGCIGGRLISFSPARGPEESSRRDITRATWDNTLTAIVPCRLKTRVSIEKTTVFLTARAEGLKLILKSEIIDFSI
jgi:hypothetical protein